MPAFEGFGDRVQKPYEWVWMGNRREGERAGRTPGVLMGGGAVGHRVLLGLFVRLSCLFVIKWPAMMERPTFRVKISARIVLPQKW